MQSTDIFTVGGSISVNAHGMDHQAGAVGNTIHSIRVMLPDGTIKKISLTEETEFYNLVLGGYGLFGVILDVELEITDNVVYDSKRQLINYQDFTTIFNQQIDPDKDIGLFYGHLSTAPSSFLKEMILYTYKKSNDFTGEIPPLGEVSNVPLRRLVINLAKHGSIAQEIKWFSEKYLEPKITSCLVNRNQALKEGESCLVSRNEPMHDSVKYLNNDHKDETDILQEYFIPREKFVEYVDGMRQIMQSNKANLLNASVRIVHKEENYLTYAPTDMYAIVLYLNQQADAAGNKKMATITSEMIDLTNRVGGRFFLPYQLHYTKQQLEKSYPEIKSFFKAKQKYDPDSLFTNTFYNKYSQKS